jgi:hypothetical protein
MVGRLDVRAFAATALAALLMVGLAGCNLLAPQETDFITETADGVNATVGMVDVGDAVVVSDTGKTGNLVATFTNRDSTAHRVEIQWGKNPTRSAFVNVPATSEKQVGTPGNRIVKIAGLDTAPGALLSMFFQYGSETGVRVLVPVLSGSLAPYQNLTPDKVALNN